MALGALCRLRPYNRSNLGIDHSDPKLFQCNSQQSPMAGRPAELVLWDEPACLARAHLADASGPSGQGVSCRLWQENKAEVSRFF